MQQIDRPDYRSKLPDAQGRYSYSADEDAVWAALFARQMSTLTDRAAPEFLQGAIKLGLKPARVPQVADIDARLHALSGAGAEGVPAIIAPDRFYDLLSQRRFPVATFLRRREEMDYIEEPDIFHEVFGHCPLLTLPVYADVIQKFGRLGKSLGKGYSWRLSRLFWFTVEFGLIRRPEGLRVFGAGIVSSLSETLHATSRRAEMLEFDLMTVLRTPYRIDILQPAYFVIDSFEQLSAALDQDVGAMIDEAKRLGDLPPRFDPLR